MAKKKKDIQSIKTYYIRHDISIANLAKRYKISESSIFRYKRLDPENWDEAKRKYKEEVAKKTLENLKDRDAESLADAQRQLDAIIIKAIDVLNHISMDKDQFRRHETSPSERMNTGMFEYMGEKIDTKSFLNYVKAVSEINSVIKTNTETNNANDSINVAFNGFKDEYAE